MTATSETTTTPDKTSQTVEVHLDAAQVERERQVTEEVLRSFAGTPSPRIRQLVTGLVEHLHAYAREMRLSTAEWEAAIGFLTDTGHITTDKRQEFILLSDVLGLSMQTITINNAPKEGQTESTLFGPFFVDGAPRIEQGGDLSFGAQGEPLWVEGVVRDVDGSPIEGARIEVWECDEDGLYDVQYTDDRTACRAHLFSAQDGSYRFWGLRPVPYPIPTDGPVGRLLGAAERSPMRAAHLHFMVTAPGKHTLITHIFDKDDDYVGRDSVFGVKPALVMAYEDQPAGTPTPDGRELSVPWSRVRFDITLGEEEQGRDPHAAVSLRTGDVPESTTEHRL